MIYISIALVLIAVMATFIANKFLNIKQKESEKITAVNNEAAEAALNAALDERLKSFDQRINKTWETINLTKSEIESLKLATALRAK
jgi:type II secretory pathway pseudopilin PulG